MLHPWCILQAQPQRVGAGQAGAGYHHLQLAFHQRFDEPLHRLHAAGVNVLNLANVNDHGHRFGMQIVSQLRQAGAVSEEEVACESQNAHPPGASCQIAHFALAANPARVVLIEVGPLGGEVDRQAPQYRQTRQPDADKTSPHQVAEKSHQRDSKGDPETQVAAEPGRPTPRFRHLLNGVHEAEPHHHQGLNQKQARRQTGRQRHQPMAQRGDGRCGEPGAEQCGGGAATAFLPTGSAAQGTANTRRTTQQGAKNIGAAHRNQFAVGCNANTKAFLHHSHGGEALQNHHQRQRDGTRQADGCKLQQILSGQLVPHPHRYPVAVHAERGGRGGFESGWVHQPHQRDSRSQGNNHCWQRIEQADATLTPRPDDVGGEHQHSNQHGDPSTARQGFYSQGQQHERNAVIDASRYRCGNHLEHGTPTQQPGQQYQQAGDQKHDTSRSQCHRELLQCHRPARPAGCA